MLSNMFILFRMKNGETDIFCGIRLVRDKLTLGLRNSAKNKNIIFDPNTEKNCSEII